MGDTTTTMMWIAGRSPLAVLSAYVASIACFAVFAVPAAMAQQTHQPILKHDVGAITPDWVRLAIVATMLIAAIAANVVTNIAAPHIADVFPVIGVCVVGGHLHLRVPAKNRLGCAPEGSKGAPFLLALVLCASFMPVEALPAASWETTFSLGFISAVFDNIPLTALALEQGGYDWGLLAYAVGFGGSMMWSGASAGVAVSNLFPEAKSAMAWLRAAWWLPAAYLVGFFVMLGLLAWSPVP